VALRVDDIVAALAELKAKGVRLIDEVPRPGHDFRSRSCATAAPEIRRSESVVDMAALAMPVRATAPATGERISEASAGNAWSGMRI
jgi:hypothetical protein